MRPTPWRGLAPSLAASLPLSLLLACALAVPPAARAQSAAISTNLDLSVRAAGMGRCSNAVFWGGDLDAWSNPALLGYQSGLRYENARTKLVPDLANDVFLTTNRVAVGGGGLGFLIAGKPISGLGSVHLDYGVSQATDQLGNPLGTFDSYEDVRSWGMGVSLGRVAGTIARAYTGHTPRVLRHVDVALGVNHKDVHVQLVPQLPGLPGTGAADGSSDDEGIFVRVSPYDSFDGGGFLPGLDRNWQLAIDGSFGGSTLNQHAPLVVFPGAGSADAMVEERHKGWAAHVALQPLALTRHFEDRHLRWLARSLTPALSLGGAWDRNTLDSQRFDNQTFTTFPARSHIVQRGFEITLFQVFSLRRGHISDPDGSVHGSTTGWSLGYAFEGAVGFRYDRATVPQATDPQTGQRFADVHRRAWSVFVDPLHWLTRERTGPGRTI